LEWKTKTPAGEVANVRPRRSVATRRLTGHPRKAKSSTEINPAFIEYFKENKDGHRINIRGIHK
jgi:hypothetical protein